MRSVELEEGISCPRRSWDIWRILLSPRAGSVGKLGVCDMVEALLHGSSVHSSDEKPWQRWPPLQVCEDGFLQWGWSLNHCTIRSSTGRTPCTDVKQWWVCVDTAWWSRDRNKAWPHEAGRNNPVTFPVIHPTSCVLSSSWKAGREGRCLGGRREGRDWAFPLPSPHGYNVHWKSVVCLPMQITLSNCYLLCFTKDHSKESEKWQFAWHSHL